jgi:hypothetical protein
VTDVSELGAPEQSAEALAEALVDGLAARAEAIDVRALGAGVEEVRSRAAAGRTPVGMYRLAEVLTPGPLPPAPRQPIGDPAATAECVRRNPTTVLDGADPSSVAQVITALVGDGLRLLVSGPAADELAAVRAALPTDVAGLCLEGPQPLSATELRELRALLVTSTRERADRLRQLLPDPATVPDAELVAELCIAAGRPGYPPTTSAELVPELLGELPANRLNALIETARQCDIAVSALNRDGEAPWSWDLLEGLLFGQSWHPFERLVALCSETIELAEGLRDAGDQLAVVGTIEPEDLGHLRRYADFLDTGGHARSYFRSLEQRAAEPVLRQLRLDSTPLKDSKILRQALSFVQLIGDMDRIGEDCRLLDLPAPADIPAVSRLLRRLEVVSEAVRAVEVLRHEVLFIHPTSPVSMPDMEATEAVARAIISSGGAAEMAAARRELAELGDRFADTLPARLFADTVRVDTFAGLHDDPEDSNDSGSDSNDDSNDDSDASGDDSDDDRDPVPAPEYLAAVRALRENRLPDYLEALRGLAAARRDQAEQQRLEELLGRLREAAPGLADAWQRTGGRTFAPGTVRFQPVGEVLAALPDADTLDAVLLVGADQLDPGYLVIAAAAPRLLVASASGPIGVPAPYSAPGQPMAFAGRLSAEGETVSTMLRRAGVPVITSTEHPAPNGGPGGGGGAGGDGAGGDGAGGDGAGEAVKAKEPAA